MKGKLKQGLSVHCHHDILVEYCYDYQERVDYIKKKKPKNEIKTRLKLFKILPNEALKDIPAKYLKANEKWDEISKKWDEAHKKWLEACKKRVEAHNKWLETHNKRVEAHNKWLETHNKRSQKDKDKFHKKWCGCKDWKNGEIIFKDTSNEKDNS